MPENRYLSIGEVLGLLLEDFPDVTISKIRFLESQGLIEPERTPSGYRKFYDHDVDLLRTILHEQRENFLPLKVIRDRIESGGIQADNTGGRTPPRGIRNVAVASPEASAPLAETRDSVFRRTDGGPEWAEGRPFTPGSSHESPSSPITAAVAVVPRAPTEKVTRTHLEVDTVAVEVELDVDVDVEPAVAPVSKTIDVAALIESPVIDPVASHPAAPGPAAPEPEAPEPVLTESTGPTVSRAASKEPGVPATPQRVPIHTDALPFDRAELCAAASITSTQLDELESFGLIHARGSGRDATYPPDCVDIARIAGQFLANGIDARHLRAWRQAAEREADLFEQRIMPLMRQRNPHARQAALETLTELADLGGELRSALMHSVLRHHFDGS